MREAWIWAVLILAVGGAWAVLVTALIRDC